MNTPLRRVGLAMLAMIVLLLANATYIQIVKADDYRTDSRNQRVLLEEYARQRGKILTSDDQIIANVKSTSGRLQYQRTYLDGPLYAPVTGFYSVRYGSTGLESAEDEILNGSDDRLFVRRLSDLITGRDPRGGNIVTTVNSKVQKAAYDAMMANGFTGAVVAIKPDDGQILAMVSTPSYDPSGLASQDGEQQQQAWNSYQTDEKPMLNRAISENYAPGSTFKLVTAAAGLADGKNKDSRVTTAAGINVINGDTNCDTDENTCLANYSRSTCGTGSLESALQNSCNTAFAQLADELGEDKLRDQAAKFGIGETDLRIPMSVVPSCIGPRADDQCMVISDRAALFQSGIGQKDVRMTALENASIAASIANGGERMRPQLVQRILAPDLDEISGYDEESLGEAMSSDDAAELRDMMVKSEENTGGGGKRDDLTIASKTGTAETGVDPKNAPPFAWYVAFAPADNPQIAVAVVVESKDVAATGGKLSAAVGRATIEALVGGS
ncbi:peptidoglycan D,D-transpeptidase FtsI family protein [Actinophytocola algeriensis]|jgi:peptidoglycan glycosyltransferase|uniref:Peptidoglycan glycosyltransferase n=1 Tax=Actinophytocola algeriensis TaxID=1768010 RepID=A0A7W7VDZ9_9PSEU|nr:penicillin-binding protein 2 [Actinophytocola algeriensis]MBB4906733.1 peptidoglycan glycosyltransferase [Actinophytocola algeriensis]MBE1478214.1 peptidoglycan glycosyltransferase [Actinophytocola algeriensis]